MNVLYLFAAAPVSHWTRSIPYAKLETTQQRRQSREREREIRRLQQHEREVHAKLGRVDRSEGVSDTSGYSSAGISAPKLSVMRGARPKERLEGKGEGGCDPKSTEEHEFSEYGLGGVRLGSEKDTEKHDEKCLTLRLNSREPDIKRQNGTLQREAQTHGQRTESRDSERNSDTNDLVIQLMDNYTDSQTMVKNLRQQNEEYAEKIETLNVQLSMFENWRREDKLRTETQTAELKHLRGEHSDQLAGMSERIEALEKRHIEDQDMINTQRQQLAALSTELQQTTESRRLELDQFERFRLDSQQELASQQQNLASCHTSLERLQSAVSRQREILECSICLGLFSRPVTLTCGHTFCDVCIQTNRYSAVLPDNCPLCRQFIGTPVRSAVVGQLVDLAQELEQCHV